MKVSGVRMWTWLMNSRKELRFIQCCKHES